MNALQLLKEDHQKVKKLLEEASDTTERAVKTRESLFVKIKQELTVHEQIEEQIFYPRLKEYPKVKDLILESYEEHHVIDLLLAEISNLSTNDEAWAAKLKVLKENVEHHVHEEEDNLFPDVKKILDNQTLQDIGEKMNTLKKKLLHEITVAT